MHQQYNCQDTLIIIHLITLIDSIKQNNNYKKYNYNSHHMRDRLQPWRLKQQLSQRHEAIWRIN